jgi:voltage-gated potassium channel
MTAPGCGGNVDDVEPEVVTNGRDTPPGAHKTRIEERFRRRAERAIANRRVFRYLAGAMLVLSFAAGVLAWLVDRRDFQTLGDALWWALVTVATVGYGDVVPRTAWGRVIGSAVIVMGITFLSILTATVTSYFVSADQAERMADVEAMRGAEDDDIRAMLRDIGRRLDSIEDMMQRAREP